MLFFVFFVAVLNLAIGYAMGAGWTLSTLLDRLPLPKRKPKAEGGDLEDDEQLTRPAPAAAPAKPAPAAPAPAAEAPAAEPAPKKLSPEEVMASLSSFREKLTEVSGEVKESQEDPDQLGASANKLQEANQAYLEEAEGAIQQLDELGAAGDAGANAASKAVAEGAEQAAQLSGELGGLIDAGLEEKANRDKVVATSEQMIECVQSAEDSVKEAIASAETEKPAEEPAPKPAPEPAPKAEKKEAEDSDPDDEGPAPALDSFDELFNRLEVAFEEAEPESTHHIAAIRVDPIADHEDDTVLFESIEQEVAELTRQLLESSQSFVAGKPAMALLDGDNFDSAADRLERIRQQVAATTFNAASGDVQATVTCAVIDAHPLDERDKLIEQLNSALDEAVRQGCNKTFHHDGAFPTPLDERKFETKPKSISV